MVLISFYLFGIKNRYRMIENKQILFKGISYSYVYIFVYLITGILTTPILLNYFKSEYFALLMLIYSIITYLNNIRFGLPESLAALIAKGKGVNQKINLIKKTFYILLVLTSLLLCFLYIMGYFIDDWRIILGDVYHLNENNVLNVLYILILFALIRIPLDLSLSAFIGMNEVYLEKIYKIINLLMNFILVIYVIYFDKSIVFFALWAGIFDLSISLFSFIHLILKHNVYKVSRKNISVKTSYLLKSGYYFFQLSLTQAIIWGLGILLVSHLLTLDDVTTYSLSMKIYIYIFYTFTIINTVLAPLYGKYYAKNKWNELNKTFGIMMFILPTLGGFIWFGTIFFMSEIILIWTGSNDYYIGSLFTLLFGMFFYFTGYVNNYITLIYSVGHIRNIIYIRWYEVFLNVLISIVCTYLFGLIGIALGISISIVLTSVILLPKYIKDSFKNKIMIDFKIHMKQFKFIILPSVIIALLSTTYVSIIWVKLIIFLFLSLFYVISSWKIASPNEKSYIMQFIAKSKSND